MNHQIDSRDNQNDFPERKPRVKGIDYPEKESYRHTRHLQIGDHVQNPDEKPEHDSHRKPDDAKRNRIENAHQKSDKALGAKVGLHQKIRFAEKVRFFNGIQRDQDSKFPGDLRHVEHQECRVHRDKDDAH